MRLLCPHCQRGITVSDSDAGKPTNCPLCGQSFVAPELYTSIADMEGYGVVKEPEPTPPPVVEEPKANPTPTSTPTPPKDLDQVVADLKQSIAEPASAQPKKDTNFLPPGTPSGFEHFYSISIPLHVIQWIPQTALTLAFFLTFFTWVGSFPGGYPAYTQNGWQALVASFSFDGLSEEVFSKSGDIHRKTLEENTPTNLMLFFYLIGLILAVALAWVDDVVRWFKIQIPKEFKPYWDYRTQALVGLTALVLAILLLQSMIGFGIEKGARRIIQEKYKEQMDAAETKGPVEKQKITMAQEGLLAAFQFTTTSWLRLSIWLNMLALLAIGIENLLVQRKDKPAPKVGLMW